MNQAALEGIRLMDFSHVYQGPVGTQILADYGADVIRVAMPGDEGLPWKPLISGTSRSFGEETVNRNKRSVAIDLREPAGAETFLTLVASADMVIENFN